MSKVMVNVDRYGNTSSASILWRWRRPRRRSVEARYAGDAGGLRCRLHLGQRGHPVVIVLLCPGQGAQRSGWEGTGRALPARAKSSSGLMTRWERRFRA